MSSYEMRKCIHKLEDELREKSGWLDSYARQFVPLKVENIKLSDENAKLRELVRDMWRDGMCDCDEFSRSIGVCVKCEYGYLERMRELGIEMG
jgi:hypothetical protein